MSQQNARARGAGPTEKSSVTVSQCKPHPFSCCKVEYTKGARFSGNLSMSLNFLIKQTWFENLGIDITMNSPEKNVHYLGHFCIKSKNATFLSWTLWPKYKIQKITALGLIVDQLTFLLRNKLFPLQTRYFQVQKSKK